MLRERAEGELAGGPWRVRAYLQFQKRRMTRILAPCYAAMVFAVLVGAPDIRQHFLAYFGHVANFHMAQMEQWPSGTAHFWTLAIQMQFYLLWPLVVFGLPRRMLGPVLAGCVVMAPLSRVWIEGNFPQIYHSEAITLTALDYFGVGALLAFALERGMRPGDGRLRAVAGLAFVGYALLYGFDQAGHPVAGLHFIQQTLVSVVFAGLISATLAGFGGTLGKVLDHPAIQHVGRISFGLYLFHAPLPLLLGWVLPWLWHPFFGGPWLVLRLVVFWLASWATAYGCYRYLEHQPVRVKAA